MSTTMRLKRFGAKKRPYYRVVVQDNRLATSSRTIDEIGFYRPVEEKDQIVIDAEKAKAWMAKGAQPTDTVKALFKKHGVI